MSSLPQSTCSMSSSTGVLLLRVLALFICAFLAAVFFYKLPDEATSSSGAETSRDTGVPSKSKPANESNPNNQSTEGVSVLQSLAELLPHTVLENTKLVWQHGRDNPLAVASVGLLTCLTAIFLAGPARYAFITSISKDHPSIKDVRLTCCCTSRLRSIDAASSVLWFLVFCLYLTESYFEGGLDWMHMAKLITIPLCCLVSLAAAVASHRPLGPRRARYRRSEFE